MSKTQTLFLELLVWGGHESCILKYINDMSYKYYTEFIVIIDDFYHRNWPNKNTAQGKR